MRILLDTHIFLCFISGDAQLSTDVRDAIRDPDNEIYLSSVSVWEAIVKYQLGFAASAGIPRNILTQTA